MRVLRSLLLVLLPTAIYLLWLTYLYYRARRTGTTDVPALREGPWFWLVMSGLALAIASYVAASLTEEGIPRGQYQPPRLENGEVVPGRRAPAP